MFHTKQKRRWHNISQGWTLMYYSSWEIHYASVRKHKQWATLKCICTSKIYELTKTLKPGVATSIDTLVVKKACITIPFYVACHSIFVFFYAISFSIGFHILTVCLLSSLFNSSPMWFTFNQFDGQHSGWQKRNRNNYSSIETFPNQTQTSILFFINVCSPRKISILIKRQQLLLWQPIRELFFLNNLF